MQETITRWLPSVSRPGDTVFIYFCTHGGRITGLKEDPDPGTRNIEPSVPGCPGGDQFTYYFVPHEYVNYEKFTDQIGLITAAFYAPASRPRRVGMGLGQQRQENLEEREGPEAGNLLGGRQCPLRRGRRLAK